MDRYIVDIFENDLTESRLSKADRMVRDVAIMSGRNSRNNRTYSDRAMDDVVRLSEGAPAFLDHESKADLKSRDGVRSVKDLIGKFTGVTRSGDRVRGSLKVLGSMWNFMESIAELGSGAGFSIHSQAAVSVGKDGREVIEQVKRIKSIDLVSTPAMVSGLWESHSDREGWEDVLETSDADLLDLLKSDFLDSVGVRKSPYRIDLKSEQAAARFIETLKDLRETKES
jgi:hypothetical protein